MELHHMARTMTTDAASQGIDMEDRSLCMGAYASSACKRGMAAVPPWITRRNSRLV